MKCIFGVHITHAAEETHRLGREFADALTENAVVAFHGDLGAGKTTFIRGLVEGVGSTEPRSVSSPTFTFLNIYEGSKKVYHFDLYRLPRKEEFFAAGFDEYFSCGGVCCLEWAEKLGPELPAGAYFVRMSYLGEERRQIEIGKANK